MYCHSMTLLKTLLLILRTLEDCISKIFNLLQVDFPFIYYSDYYQSRQSVCVGYQVCASIFIYVYLGRVYYLCRLRPDYLHFPFGISKAGTFCKQPSCFHGVCFSSSNKVCMDCGGISIFPPRSKFCSV